MCLFLLIPLVSHLSGPTGWFAGWSTNLCFAAEAPASQASPLPGNHRLDDVAAGQVLLAELGCARCHAGLPTQSVATKQAPHLTEVGSRVSPEYLQRYLADPTAVHRGTTMPDVLGERSPEERQVIATALTHFLISLGNESFRSEVGETADRDRGRRLYHTVGCVACHPARDPAPQAGAQPNTPRPDPDTPDETEEPEEDALPTQPTFRPIALGLKHILTKYSETSLAAFLHEPLAVRPSGRMPDLKLTTEESRAIAQYLLGDEPPRVAPLKIGRAHV